MVCGTAGDISTSRLPDSWKARHISDGDQVAVTLPIRQVVHADGEGGKDSGGAARGCCDDEEGGDEGAEDQQADGAPVDDEAAFQAFEGAAVTEQ